MKHPVLLFFSCLLALLLCGQSPAATPATQNQTKVLTTTAKYRHGQSPMMIQQTQPVPKPLENISTQDTYNSGASVFDLKKCQLLASCNQSSNSPNIIQWYQKAGSYSFTVNNKPNTVVYYFAPAKPSLPQSPKTLDWKQGVMPIEYPFDPSAYKQRPTGK